MQASIRHFAEALLAPEQSFRTLGEATVVLEENGLPRIYRTTRFAEAEIDWRGKHYLLSMPLHPSAAQRAERIIARLRSIRTQALTPCRLLPQELCTEGVAATDLVLQQVPEGRPLSEMPGREYGTTLLAALDALEAELKQAGFVHNNLKPANLIWAGGRLYPLRYHDASFGTDGTGDAAAFEALRELVRTQTGCAELGDATVSYEPAHTAGHVWSGYPSEGLVCVEDEAGYGYVDTQNRVVIPAQFRWAGDFHEGRAEVQTAGGMGLIDRTGGFVLEPVYEIVDYDPATSRIRARREGAWAEFDYTGRQLTAFAPAEPPAQQAIETTNA